MAYGHFKSLVNGVDKPTFFTGGHLILWVDDQFFPGTCDMVSGCRIKTSGGRPTH